MTVPGSLDNSAMAVSDLGLVGAVAGFFQGERLVCGIVACDSEGDEEGRTWRES
jgi:hypothetical protein